MSPKRRSPADEPFLLIRSSSSDMPAGPLIGKHRHDWHQLIYVAAGLMVVDTENGSWLAPPSWAVWAPAGMAHAIRFVTKSSLRTLYVRPDRRPDLPFGCCSLAVSPLLRELVVRVAALGMLDQRDAGETAMATLIVAEFGRVGGPPFSLAQPTSDETRRAARLLTPGSGEEIGLPAVARAIGMGARTLERRFRDETGLTPGRWRQQWKLLKSLELIASGATVKTAAAETGFASASAYVAAFRKLFGTTPAQYFAPR